LNCSVNEEPVQNQIESIVPIEEYNVEVPEPSGLCFAKDKKSLYTVSDKTGKIYQLDLKGKVINTLSFKGNDLEGITYDSTTNTIWVTEEVNREIVQLDLNGTEQKRKKIIEGSDNTGLEGICITSDNIFYVLKEKSPGQLIKLNSDLTVNRVIVMDFASDYSGICSDTLSDRFWMVSDESRKLFLWDKDSGTIHEYKIPIEKAEGVAYDAKNNKVYIISDSEEKMYVFTM